MVKKSRHLLNVTKLHLLQISVEVNQIQHKATQYG